MDNEKQEEKNNEAIERKESQQQNIVDSGSVNLETPSKELTKKKKKIILVANPNNTKNVRVNRPIQRPTNVLEAQEGQRAAGSNIENQKPDTE